jgi:hypothetical protein
MGVYVKYFGRLDTISAILVSSLDRIDIRFHVDLAFDIGGLNIYLDIGGIPWFIRRLALFCGFSLNGTIANIEVWHTESTDLGLFFFGFGPANPKLEIIFDRSSSLIHRDHFRIDII